MTRDVRDPRLPFSGGSDRWDRGEAGQIVTAEFFGEGETPPSGGLLAAWSGNAWVPRAVKVWTGSAWAVKPAKRWTGTAWVLS